MLPLTLREKRTGFTISTALRAITNFQKKGHAVEVPVPVEDIARSLGFRVVLLSTVDDEFSALVSIKDKLIGINARHHPHRQRFSISHEIAHILLKHPPESRCTNHEIDVYNAQADLCASELLIPGDLLAQWMQKTKNPVELARIFNVSVDAMTRKMKCRKLPKNS